MIFIFNSLQRKEGIWGCNDVNTSTIKRFTPSPLVTTLIRHKTLKKTFDNYSPSEIILDTYPNRKKHKNIIIPSGVTHSPWDWTGYTDLDKKYDENMLKRSSVFSHIDKKLLGMLRKRQAYLLLDQSHEGYHTNWLFQWFHDACEKYEIEPRRIIYVTGNLAVETQYTAWCASKNITNKMLVVPHIQFEEFIYDCTQKQKDILPDVEEHIKYKTESNLIKTYNCFQKRSRPHRIWMFYYLYKNGLLNDGINTMNSFAHQNSYYENRIMSEGDYKELIEYLPMYPRDISEKYMKDSFKGGHGGNFEKNLYHQETRESWVSVISEASYAEDTCFISEKSFKPIATRHPFIMCGNKNSLRYLRELGYKTFDGFIDESYDSMDTWDRYESIIKNIKTIRDMSKSQKIEWYMGMKDILDHNFNTLIDNTTKLLPSAVLKIKEHVGE